MPKLKWLSQRREQWFSRRHPSQNSAQTLKYDRIYILPSGFGYAFTFTALLVLIGAINYQLSLAYLFAFTLLGLGHAILLRTFRNLLKLRLQLFDAPAVFAGETAYFPLQLNNPNRLTKRAIYFYFKQKIKPLALECGVIERDAHLSIPLLSQRRGWLFAPTLHLSSHYPMGLCHAWSYLNSPARCLVWPHPEIDPPPWAPSLGGGHTAQTGMGEEDFAGLRPYTPSDSLRRIAWKQAAHSETLPVKFFDAEGLSPQVFNWDQLNELDNEARLSRLVAWILAAEQMGVPYGLALPHMQIDAEKGAAHQISCLNALALFE
ncbi:DUF58 domain-containing protein [Iodobacter sp.]|uniref:DUF58 domain-containing protein n=1 Tax=Iodobacter sp. TaxID=1915058 RepID=UPI0025CEF815|nr:DUF58 domain-containing protein [Iodobacter sp.]